MKRLPTAQPCYDTCGLDLASVLEELVFSSMPRKRKQARTTMLQGLRAACPPALSAMVERRLSAQSTFPSGSSLQRAMLTVDTATLFIHRFLLRMSTEHSGQLTSPPKGR